MTSYIFEGEVIKLNATHYYKWAELYKNLNLTEELIQLDELFQIRKMEGEHMKKWFSEAFNRLNGRNKIAGRNRSYAKHLPNGVRNSRDIPIMEERYDTRWAEEPPKRLS